VGVLGNLPALNMQLFPVTWKERPYEANHRDSI